MAQSRSRMANRIAARGGRRQAAAVKRIKFRGIARGHRRTRI